MDLSRLKRIFPPPGNDLNMKRAFLLLNYVAEIETH
jgi:hypothetical protein